MRDDISGVGGDIFDRAQVIVAACSPFILVPTLYQNNSGANFLTAAVFIVCYTLLYRRLIALEKPSIS